MEGQRFYVKARLGLAAGALWGFLGVIMLAMGSHPPQTGLMAVGGQFLLFHAAAVVAISGNSHLWGWRQTVPMALLLAGSGLFSLSMALRSAGIFDFGVMAPIGGTIAILGWLVLAIGQLVKPKS